jgi:ankyrin repeat protein
MEKCIKEIDGNITEKCVKAKDQYGRTLLHHVVSRDAGAVKRLLSRGADPNAADDVGQTPLHWAAYIGRSDIVRLLLKYGANLNIKTKYDGRTPLHVAAAYEVSVVKLLIKYGADVNARDSRGRTPLYIALEERNVDVVKALLRHGADPNMAPIELARRIGMSNK